MLCDKDKVVDLPKDNVEAASSTAAIAGFLDRGQITIAAWRREDKDPYSIESIEQFWRWKESRIKNRPNHEKPARRIQCRCSCRVSLCWGEQPSTVRRAAVQLLRSV
jgi:hypothetical protein